MSTETLTRSARPTRELGAGVVIAGGGLAGQRCAEALRQLGYGGRIRVVGDEPWLPYDRVPLSKGVLTGERDPRRLHFRAAEWYAAHGVELLLGARVRSLDAHGRRVRVSGGTALRYERLVVATGSHPRRLPSIAPVEGVFQLHRIDEALGLAHCLRASERPRLVIVGGGLIGQEVAAAAARLDARVTLVEAAPSLLAQTLPSPLRRWLADRHRQAGIDVLVGTTVARLHVTRGRVVAVGLSDGSRRRADAVLVAVGTGPATEWVTAGGLAGLALPTDAGGRTRLPNVYAAGGSACYPAADGGPRSPTQHWEAAHHQGVAVAHSILGRPAPRAPVSCFWSDQHGIRMHFVGHLSPEAAIEIEGDPSAADFIARWRRGGQITGALLVGRSRELGAMRQQLRGELERVEPSAA